MKLFIILLGIILLYSCALHEGTVDLGDKKEWRAHVKEKCRVFYNWGISDDAFIEYVYRMVNDGWIDIRVIRWTGAVKKRGSIVTVVVYYDN